MSNRLYIRKLKGEIDVQDTVEKFADQRLLVLLDSAARTPNRSDSRFTILTADPVATCRIDSCQFGDTPFATLREWSQVIPSVDCPDLPFCGGIAGLLGYELGNAFEMLPRSDFRSPFETPDLLAGLFDWAIVWDHDEPATFLCVLDLDNATDAKRTRQQRIEWVDDLLNSDRPPNPKVAGHRELPSSPPNTHLLPGYRDVRSNFAADEYVAAVERVIEYIRAGDIFQANLSQQLCAPWDGNAIELYRETRRNNPAPFAGLLQADTFAVVSASPERFLKVSDGRKVETRPIKGTRRRHRSPIADLYTGSELVTSEKDRAENVMIVDLLRNDISRVCRPGSVKVTGLCEVEVFETVQHLVSTIVGELQNDRDIWDLCAATIPGGSITGAPKIRAMEIIHELEQVSRGAYCGNLFYHGANGTFDSSILIRTFTLMNGLVQFPVGGGIVADSQPNEEYAETLHKAAGMLNSIKAISAQTS